MPNERIYSRSMASVAQLSDAALDAPDGIDVVFSVTDYGSLAACSTMARSMQTNFASMRARERQQAMKLREKATGNQAALDTVTHGKYDKLILTRRIMPDDAGWVVSLIPQHTFLSSLNVIDRATGKPLATIGRDRDEKDVLIEKFVMDRSRFTPADKARLIELDPGMSDYLNTPAAIAAPPVKVAPIDEVDLEELAAFGGGEEEG